MNPLGLAKWGGAPAQKTFVPLRATEGPLLELPEEGPEPVLISRMEEWNQLAARAGQSIEIRVNAYGTRPAQTVRVPWSSGASLKQYFSQLGLVRTASYRAVYDMTNLSKGRVRLSYTPECNAVIQIQKSDVGVSSHMQRTRVDAQSLAANMGARSGGPSPKVVEHSMLYAPAAKPQPPKESDDDIGIEQI